jgi:hypothetical protein
MFKKLLDSAKGLADKVEITTKLHTALETTKQVATERYEASKTKAAELVEGNRQRVEGAIAAHWPTVEAEVVKRLVNVAEGKLSDSASVQAAFMTTYELLPAPVRLLLPRQSFIDYCMSHRDPLLAKVSAYKAENWAALGYASQEQALGSVPLRLDYGAAKPDDDGAAASTTAPASAGDTKVCPQCAEAVKAAALVCRYCTHRFEVPER